jgi:hypothetical protein
MTGGAFWGLDLNGVLLPGAVPDWQVVLEDGTALAHIRLALQTDQGDLLYVRSFCSRRGPTEVFARLGRGEEVEVVLASANTNA